MVPDRAQSGDLADGDRGDEGAVAELFTGVDVGEVDLDDGARDGGKGVTQGDAGVGGRRG